MWNSEKQILELEIYYESTLRKAVKCICVLLSGVLGDQKICLKYNDDSFMHEIKNGEKYYDREFNDAIKLGLENHLRPLFGETSVNSIAIKRSERSEKYHTDSVDTDRNVLLITTPIGSDHTEIEDGGQCSFDTGSTMFPASVRHKSPEGRGNAHQIGISTQPGIDNNLLSKKVIEYLSSYPVSGNVDDYHTYISKEYKDIKENIEKIGITVKPYWQEQFDLRNKGVMEFSIENLNIIKRVIECINSSEWSGLWYVNEHDKIEFVLSKLRNYGYKYDDTLSTMLRDSLNPNFEENLEVVAKFLESTVPEINKDWESVKDEYILPKSMWILKNIKNKFKSI